MPHQDQGRLQGTHAAALRNVLCWVLADVSLKGLKFRDDCSWTPRALVWAGLLWSWSDEPTLRERFARSHKITERLLSSQQKLAGSYQAFVKLLRKWTPALHERMQMAFRRRMSQLDSFWKIGRWIVLAVDGSRVEAPRTRANELRYSPKSKLSRVAQKRRARRRRRVEQRRQEANARKANVPRMWVTAIWHVGLALPWDWRLGPSDSSERAHLLDMLPALPPQALIVADAGFVGYDVWQTILNSNRSLLVRVGSHVRLLKKLGRVQEREGTVYVWPDAVAQRCQPPLVLRLIVLESKGRPVYLVANPCDARQLSDRQAAEIYRRCWGIELFYRHCKQTFERAKLRSHNPDNAQIEMEWSLLGMWAMGLHAHFHLTRRGIPPQRISFVGVLRAYRRPMQAYQSKPDAGESLTQLLNRAVIDNYVRINKASRDYPRKKQHKAPGKPRIHVATQQQIALVQALTTNDSTRRLTA